MLYPNIDISVLCLDVGRKIQPLTEFLKYLPKNVALLAKKLWRIFLVNLFPAILRQKRKVSMATKPGEGGLGVSGWTSKKRIFCGFPKLGFKRM